MNETVVRSWFTSYSSLVEDLNISEYPERFLNCDESGLQDQFDKGVAVGEVGRPCYRITPCENGTTTTVMAAFNAAGEFGPPMIIFKGQRVKPEWCVGSPEKTIVRCSKNGWITSELLIQWAEMFLQVIPDDGLKRILLLDGHVTHTYNYHFLEPFHTF